MSVAWTSIYACKLYPISKLSGLKPGSRPSPAGTLNFLKFLDALKTWLNTAGSHLVHVDSLSVVFVNTLNLWSMSSKNMRLPNQLIFFLRIPRRRPKKSIVYGLKSIRPRTATNNCRKMVFNTAREKHNPFRLSGNIEWGAPIPNEPDLTFWVWPESLWALFHYSNLFVQQGEDKGLGSNGGVRCRSLSIHWRGQCLFLWSC